MDVHVKTLTAAARTAQYRVEQLKEVLIASGEKKKVGKKVTKNVNKKPAPGKKKTTAKRKPKKGAAAKRKNVKNITKQ